ncbi:MAG: glycosyltransferase [Tateyamaria sp.]
MSPVLLFRLLRIFARYSDTHLSRTGACLALRSGQGEQVGQVERMALAGTRLIVTGRSTADRIVLRLGASDHAQTPAPSAEGTGGLFHFDLPFEPGPFTLVSEIGPDRHAHPQRGFHPREVALARVALALRFGMALVRLRGDIWRWKVRGDLTGREVVKEELGLVLPPATGRIDPAVLALPPGAVAALAARSPARLTVILPVYNAFEMLQEALDRVLRHTDLPWRLVLVDDASPDPRVSPWLSAWAADQSDRVTLLRNAENLGFVGAVNAGLAVAEQWRDDPVVLLNSDAMVPQGWASRLLAPLADPAAASVTPFSNDAEIFTAPVLCQPHDLPPGHGDALDAAARDLQAGISRPEAPTGVGFCMALAPRFLHQVPRLDPAFGRGYGEETDWCQKTRALGGRHVCAQNLFVEHRGGASFGSAAKQVLLEKSAAELARRYPRYDADVETFLRTDPLTTPRLALALSAAALGGQEVPVYLAHALGGGADSWLQARLAQHVAAGQAGVVLRVGQSVPWQVEVHGPQGMTAGTALDATVLAPLMARLPRRRIVYSCGVGHPQPLELPEVLTALAAPDHPVEVLVHDFFPISPSYTLLGQAGHFDGVPVAGQGGAADDPAHVFHRPDGPPIDLRTWQAAWGRLMDRADHVVVFSDSSRDIMAAAYPQTAAKTAVQPHALPSDVPRIPAPKAGSVIGVLGNIGAHKGAGVLSRLSRDLAAAGAPRDPACPRLVVLGHLAPEFGLARPSHVHGAYRIEDLPGLVARYGITGWFIPSIWPETFSFTTHEALATGLPVVAFDLGAQGDAVRAAAHGRVLARDAIAAPDLGHRLIAALQD